MDTIGEDRRMLEQGNLALLDDPVARELLRRASRHGWPMYGETERRA